MAYTTIDDPSAYFKVQLYTGTGDAQSITFNDTDTNMQPDLLWQKSRSHSQDPRIFDAVRGGSKMLYPSITNAEETDAQFITAFGSDGFTMGTAGGNANDSGTTYVAWCWKESATAGFDIVTYTGNGTDDTDISHNLSAVPHVIICKVRDVAGEQWKVYHHKNTSAPETDFLRLEDTAATADDASVWSDEAPTSSVFTLGDTNGINQNTKLFVSYLWSEKQGFSKFGSYVGNGNADGPMIFLGFRPAFILTKRTDGGSNYWTIWDNKRDPDNHCGQKIYPNATNAEQTESTGNLDFVANGVKIRNNGGDYNGSGQTYIYAAFAEAPFVNSEGVPCNAR